MMQRASEIERVLDACLAEDFAGGTASGKIKRIRRGQSKQP